MHDRCADGVQLSAVRVAVAVLALTAAWLALAASGCKKDADKAASGGDSEGRPSTTLTYPPSLSAESSPSQVAEALITALDARDKGTLPGLVAARAEAQQIDAIFRKYGRPANTSLVDAAGTAASGWLATYAIFQKGQTQVRREVVEGDSAAVFAAGKLRIGKPAGLKIRLVREEGLWKVRSGLQSLPGDS